MRPLYKRILYTALFLVVPIALLFTFVVEAWRIPGDDPLFNVSILPQLEKGDLVVVSRRKSPHVGRTVRCADPDQPGRYVLARLVAANMGLVRLNQELVSVDGRREPSLGSCDLPVWKVPNPRNGEITDLKCWREPFEGVTIDTLRSHDAPVPDIELTPEAGRGILISDNRHFHLDSRDVRSVDLSTCSDVLFRITGENTASGKFGVVW